MRWNLFRESIRKFRAGAPFGDVALLKVVALDQKPREGIREQLGDLEGYFPGTDMPALRNLPQGSFGREYARFLDSNGIEPFTISDDVKARFADEVYAIRYLATHDLHHMLGGFDAGIPGEAGVLAFTVGQGSIGSVAMMVFGLVLQSLLNPTNAFRIWKNMVVGYRMGQRAKLLMAERLEDQFARPLAEVRAEYRIPNPREAGVMPSRSSWFAKLIYKNAEPKMAT